MPEYGEPGSVADNPRLTFVRGDICGARSRDALPGHDVVVNFAAESHVDRSIVGAADFVPTNVWGRRSCCGLPAGSRSCMSRPTRSTAASMRGAGRGHPARAQLALLGGKGQRRPRRPGLRQDPRPQRLHHPLLQQLRPLPVPREGHPAVRHQPDGRAEGAAVRRRCERPRLAARRRPLPGNPAGRRARPAGRVYNISGDRS